MGWTSYQAVQLPEDVPGMIGRKFDMLENNFGPRIVESILGLLCITRPGLQLRYLRGNIFF